MSRTVVVTGVGVCAANGTGVPRFWDAIVHGRSGIGPITAFDAAQLRSRIAGEVTDFAPQKHVPARTLKRLARFSQLALVAVLEALEQAGIAEGPEREDVALVIGSGIGGFDMLEREHETFLSKGPGRFSPLTVPMIIPSMAAGTLAIETACCGINLCLNTACANRGPFHWHCARPHPFRPSGGGGRRRDRIDDLALCGRRLLSASCAVDPQRGAPTRLASFRRRSRWFRDR